MGFRCIQSSRGNASRIPAPSVDDDPGICNRLIIIARRGHAGIGLEIVDCCDHALAAIDEGDIGPSVGKRRGQVYAADAGQKAMTGMNEDRVAVAGLAQGEPGFWRLVAIVGDDVTDRLVMVAFVGREWIDAGLNTSAGGDEAEASNGGARHENMSAIWSRRYNIGWL